MKKGGLLKSLLRGFWLDQFEVSGDTGSELGRTNSSIGLIFELILSPCVKAVLS